MIIIILLFLLIVVCFKSGITAKKSEERESNFVLGGMILFILFLSWIIPYTQSAYKIAQLRTFQNIDAVNIEKAIKRTLSQIETEDTSKIGLEKMEGYRAISERMEEWTNKIKEYNKELTGYKWYKSNPFLNWYVASIRDLDFIKIDKNN